MLLLTPTLRPEENLFQDWMILLFVLCMSFLAYFNTVYPAKIRSIFKAFRSDIYMRQLMREENIIPRTHIFLTFQHAIVLGLFVNLAYQIIYPHQIESWLLFLLASGGILIMYGFKWTSIQIARWLADGDFTLSEYQYRTFATNRLLAIALLPFVLILSVSDISWAPTLVYFLATLVSGVVIWRILKGTWTAIANNIPFFYIFFYICTLEILPLWIGITLISKYALK